MTVQDLPALNASLNAICTVWLLAGFICIKTGRKKAHIIFMVLALVTSSVFLTSYVTYHYCKAGVVTEFPREYVTARIIYLCILIPHIILAVVNVPLVIMTVVPAFRQRFDRHRKLAKWTFPIWLYVSVTGVLVYMMLYQWFPGEVKTVEPDSPFVEGEKEIIIESAVTEKVPVKHGVASFDTTVFEYHARPEEDVLHASFVMTNSGEGPITITGLDTSCSCLDVRSDKKIVPPGEKALIEADFSLSKLAGTAEKFVYVKTNLPEFKELRLSVRVTIDPLFEIEPKMLDWVVGERPEEKRIKFRILRDEPVNIISATSSRPSVSVCVNAIEPGKVYELILKPESTDDTMLGMIRIVTDCEIEKHKTQLTYFSVQQVGNKE